MHGGRPWKIGCKSIGVARLFLIRVYSRQQDQQKCLDWGYDIKLKTEQLDARSQSIGGILDLDGTIKSERLALNNEIGDWRDQCMQYAK